MIVSFSTVADWSIRYRLNEKVSRILLRTVIYYESYRARLILTHFPQSPIEILRLKIDNGVYLCWVTSMKFINHIVINI